MDTKVMVVSGIENLSCALSLKGVQSKDLVIVNWSGLESSYDIPHEILEEMNDLEFHIIQHFEKTDKDLLLIDQREVQGDLNDLKQQIPVGSAMHALCDNILSMSAVIVAKCDDPQFSIDISKTEVWKNEVENQFKVMRDETKRIGREKFMNIKAAILGNLDAYPNLLIVWALGNESKNIDQNMYYEQMFMGNDLLDHCILVSGSASSGRCYIESNYTHMYADHSVCAPYFTYVWCMSAGRFVRDCGTSFSAPRISVEAYHIAHDRLSEAEQAPSFANVKAALVRKIFP